MVTASPAGTRWASPNYANNKIEIYSGCNIQGFGSGHFLSFIDPLIYIDPTFIVNINVVEIPAIQLYSLSFCPEFGPDSVTSPSALLLMTSVSGGVAGLRRRSRNR
jgi:hypothetical protein